MQDAKWTVILDVAKESKTIDLLQKAELLPEIPGTTNLQLEPDTPNVSRSIWDSDIAEISRKQLLELLDVKNNSIGSKSATDIAKPIS